MEVTFKLREQAINEGCQFVSLDADTTKEVLAAAVNKALEVVDRTDVVLLTVKVDVRAYVGGVLLKDQEPTHGS